MPLLLVVKETELGAARAGWCFSLRRPVFSPTVYDDVAFGPLYQGLPPDEVRCRVDEALASVRMSDYAGRVSHHLSVGEKKRIAIATWFYEA
jgi:cobalt/nickel transport system ATP-binding protein